VATIRWKKWPRLIGGVDMIDESSTAQNFQAHLGRFGWLWFLWKSCACQLLQTRKSLVGYIQLNILIGHKTQPQDIAVAKQTSKVTIVDSGGQ
jgi:hypothetical protein